jgi:hypothetical protein
MGLAISLWVAAGCGSGSSSASDATPRSDTIKELDSSNSSSCTVTGRSKIYLNFDGVVVQKAAMDDARSNESGLVAASSEMFPRFLSWRPDRDTIHIPAIMDRLTTALASFPIDLTRVRPTTGNYRMVVFGGTSQLTTVGSTSAWSYVTTDCGHRDLDDIGFVFDHVIPAEVGDAALNVIGHFAGLDTSSTAGDCMQAMPGSTACVFGHTAMVNPATCGGAAPIQDEPAAIVAAFDCSR